MSFTSNLRRHVDCPTEPVAGDTVRRCLDDYFGRHPAVRSYVLDEQGRVRRHVVVFVAAEQIRDPATQTDPVGDADEITIMQALSGG
jgi:molybdopterin converting factor small subunit